MRLRCLIVDDNSEFLEVARRLLDRQGIDVVGVASTSADAIRQVAELRPDVTLVDINLGNESGLDLARLLSDSGGASSQVILISTYAEGDLADVLPTGPAIKFLSKSELSAAAIRAALGLTADGDAAG